MTSAAFVNNARAWGRTLEDREAARSGESLRDARPRVARKTGVPAGTLENLRNGRLKSVAAHVYFRLWAAMERELLEEMRRHERELAELRRHGLGPADHDVREALAGLEKIRAALNLGDKS